jgi:hypothetical protein
MRKIIMIRKIMRINKEIIEMKKLRKFYFHKKNKVILRLLKKIEIILKVKV